MIATNTTAPAKPTPPHAPIDVQRQFNDLIVATSAWFQSHWLQIIIAAGAGVLIVIALYALRGFGGRLCKPDRPQGNWPAIIGRAITKTTNYFIIMLAIRLVDGYADPPAVVIHIIWFFATIAVVFQMAIWAREIILGLIEHRTSAEGYQGEAVVNAMGIIRLLVTIAVFAIALVVLLGNLHVNVTGLVAGLGVGGIAIGLAAQGIFADLFAALSIIFDRPFSKGDAISYDNTSGTVEDIGLKSTRIRSVTGEERIIANKNLLDKEIQNNSRRSMRRTKFAIGAIYQTPPDVALAIPDKLKAIVEAHDMVFVRSGFVGFGDSSLDFELEFDSPSADFAAAYQARHAVGLAILKQFNDEGIEFAYPTQTTFTSDPAGKMIMPYPDVQAVKSVEPQPRQSAGMGDNSRRPLDKTRET
jgi:small-conductance mechanosensitive channel